MGAACCIAAKDRTITDGSPGESLQRHARYSPTWSFRWDNRGRVAGEETHATWSHDGGCANVRMEVKSGTTVEDVYASEGCSPMDSFRSFVWQKSPISDGNGGVSRLPSSDQAMPQTTLEVKESTDSLSISYPSPTKLSPSIPSVSSLSASPLSSQSYLPPPSLTPSRWHHRSPGNRLLRQVSDSRIPEYKSPTFSISEEPPLLLPPSWGNDSSRGSNGGSSDSWSMNAFSDLMATRRERWSFDSEASGFSQDKISGSFCPGVQACGVCTKILTQRSSYGGQKIISTNELAVVSVLNCGHVYHAECLESMTPEINKYDPSCPICTFGEKRVVKMSEKALKSKMDSKARKLSRKRVVDSDLGSNIMFGVDGKGRKMRLSSSMKSSGGKPFLRRHFSFGSKTSRAVTENQSTLRRSFFWTRSSKAGGSS